MATSDRTNEVEGGGNTTGNEAKVTSRAPEPSVGGGRGSSASEGTQEDNGQRLSGTRPSPDSATLAQPADKGDGSDEVRLNDGGSWEWKGRRLSPENNRTADGQLAQLRSAEGRFDADGDEYSAKGLTPAMRRIQADVEHGELQGCPEYTLKEANSFKFKLAEEIEGKPDVSPDEIAKQVHDGVRYTFAFDDDHYTEGAQTTVDTLGDRGYELAELKNHWDNPEYKGINSRWVDPETGQRFEVQFHTHESWAAKQATHPAYKKLNDPRTEPAERERLRAEKAEAMMAVQVPEGATDIPDYKRDFQ